MKKTNLNRMVGSGLVAQIKRKVYDKVVAAV